jgi:hypothetical protein
VQAIRVFCVFPASDGVGSTCKNRPNGGRDLRDAPRTCIEEDVEMIDRGVESCVRKSQ